MNNEERAFEALDAAFSAIEADDLEAAELKIAEALEASPELPEAHYVKGRAAEAAERDADAIAAFEAAVKLDPEYADAHYALAEALAAAGDEARAQHHALRVWSLDATADAELSDEDVQEILQIVEGEAERVLSAVPEPFAGKLADVPILVQPRPPRELVEDGFDPRALGMFEGPTQQDRSSPDAPARPTHIVLFWTNLLDIAEDDQHLGEEVEITLLHEIAHFFGLDEHEVAQLGLA